MEQAMEHGAEAATHATGGFDFAHLIQDPTVWVAIAIVLFVALVWKPAKKMLVKSTDEHAANVARQLKEARELREQAEILIQDYRAKQQQGADESRRIIEHAKAEAARITDQAVEDLEQNLLRREQQLLERIRRSESEIVQDLRAQTVDMALTATQQLLKEVLDAQRSAALLNQAMRNMPKQLH